MGVQCSGVHKQHSVKNSGKKIDLSHKENMAEQSTYPTAPGEIKYPELPGDVPPSYEATMAGGAGGFVDPDMNKTQQKYVPAPAYQPPQQTVIVQNVHFGPRPMTMICTQCQSQIVTKTESEPSVTAWILGLVLCCICWPLSCVPCCIDSLQDVNHKCPNCNKTIGTYKA